MMKNVKEGGILLSFHVQKTCLIYLFVRTFQFCWTQAATQASWVEDPEPAGLTCSIKSIVTGRGSDEHVDRQERRSRTWRGGRRWRKPRGRCDAPYAYLGL